MFRSPPMLNPKPASRENPTLRSMEPMVTDSTVGTPPMTLTNNRY